MKKSPKILLFIIAIMSFSCSDWMEQIPPQGLIREEYWQTKEEVMSVIMGAYDTFAEMDEMLFKYGEIRGDMVEGDNNQSDDEQLIMEGNITPGNYLCNWEKFYKVINYCNDVIKNAPVVQDLDNTFTDYQLQGFLSEAYFLRSLSYFYLVRIFKDVPFITEPTISDETDVYVQKTNGDDILVAILEDLRTARPFATNNGYTTIKENKGRATKASFDALMADISLWSFDYEAVLTYVQRIEANRDYQLMTQNTWFDIYYPGNSLESIFEFQFDDALNQKNSLYGLTNRDGYNYDPSTQAIEMFAKEFSNESVRGEDRTIKKYGENDFTIWKYVGIGKVVRPGTLQNSANWIIYRLSDVMLMKAEALSQLDRFNEALNIINEIRIRANIPPITLAHSKISFEDAIMDERARELAFEGKRWFDLMRMGRRNNYSRKSKFIEIIVKHVQPTQKRILAIKLTNPMGWYLPIYEEEIERNKNLVQNPYYNF